VTEMLDDVKDRKQRHQSNFSTVVSHYCSIHVLRELRTVHKLYAFFEKSLLAICQFQLQGGSRKLEVMSPRFSISV
jgi:hypothetical protein